MGIRPESQEVQRLTWWVYSYYNFFTLLTSTLVSIVMDLDLMILCILGKDKCDNVTFVTTVYSIGTLSHSGLRLPRLGLMNHFCR
jgi:hypothetical protein